MKCFFQVGQKVVFVRKADPTEYEIAVREQWDQLGLSMPNDGEVYTIREVRISWNCQDGDVPTVLLEEVRNPVMRLKTPTGTKLDEPSFHHGNFRPIITRKTDISIFKAMLTPSKHPVTA